MKSYIGLAIVLAAIVVAVHSASYSSAIGYFEGSSLRYWDFGSTSNGNSVLGRAYTINVVLPNTTGNSDDGSTGEIQPLLCSSVSCPAVFNTASASLYYSGTVELNWPISGGAANTSFTSIAALEAHDAHYNNGSLQYRRIVSSVDDVLDVGGNSTQGYFGGSAIYYFDFGIDSNSAPGVVYTVGNSTLNVTIFSSQSTHFVTRSFVTPPSDSTLRINSLSRVSDIPKAWITNATLTRNDSTIYEWGFFRVSGTPPPVDAANLVVPSFAALLFAALLVVLF